MVLGFVVDHFLICFHEISSVRNRCCTCCDSAIMPGEGGLRGLRQGERERQGLFQY